MIAKRPIKCYKYLIDQSQDTVDQSKYKAISPIRLFTYKSGRTYKDPIALLILIGTRLANLRDINRGYHACPHEADGWTDTVEWEFEIPTGAFYYIDDYNNELVASSIRAIGPTGWAIDGRSNRYETHISDKNTL
jgi:hypothetical protein